jgi:UPF0755 protein
MMPTWDKRLFKGILLLALAVLLAGGFVYSLAQAVGASVVGEPQTVTIKQGMGTQAIGELLYERGLIKNVLIFRLVVKMEGQDGSLQAGEYILTKAMTVQQIIAKLAKGETAFRQFTIPEGYTIDQIANLLETKKLASAAKFKSYVATYAPYDYMNPRPDSKYKAEGFVFPDTYRVSAGTSEEQLARMMVAQFNSQFTPEMRQQAAARGLSVREVVILASLVEKEAQVARERPIIAAVFLSRLKLEMPLQSCATIQYILGYPKPELTVQDTEIPSPYNTYLNMGLPPGPIASPGMAAIRAVLAPADTDYLYFVANKDGSHVFSRTYEEHLAAIARVSN